MTWPELPERCDGTKTLHPGNTLLLWTSRYLDRIINLKQKIILNNGASELLERLKVGICKVSDAYFEPFEHLLTRH